MALPWEQEIPPRILKLIRLGLAEGWHNYTSLVARFQKPQAKPFYAEWTITSDGKWRFVKAKVARPITAVQGFAPLGARDIPIYLQDPTVIELEDPNGHGN